MPDPLPGFIAVATKRWAQPSLSATHVTTGPVVGALLIALGGAALETLFAGANVRGRLRELRQPRSAPPAVVWVVIGLLYYATCIVVSYKLLTLRPARSGATSALAGLVALMFVNALWNLAFFRRRALHAAWRIGAVYAAGAFVFGFALFVVDQEAGWFFLPYLLYLVYGTWWTYAVYRLNVSPLEP